MMRGFLLFLVVLLSGCAPLADSSVTGTEKNVKVKVTINNSGANGIVYFVSPVGTSSTADTKQDNISPNASSTIDPQLNIAQPGSVATQAAKEAIQKLDDIKAKFEPKVTNTTTTNTDKTPVAPAKTDTTVTPKDTTTTGNDFPGGLTFERSSSNGPTAGVAAVLFSEEWEGKILAVDLNGDTGTKGASYKGRPVFYFSKAGSEFTSPLVFTIVTNEKTYTATIENTGTTDTTPIEGYAKSKTYDAYGKRNGDRYAWRISEKGTEFGSKIKIVFSDGKTFTINDTSHNCRDREDTCQRDSSADMYGFVYKPGIGENGDGDDNTGTSHGGVYLQGIYGGSSTQVTFYYN